MKFFELHFNPQRDQAPDFIFDSFCYEPENALEKRLGYLLVGGELKNVLPLNLKFLDNLAANLKKSYYSSPIKFSPENALKDCLKKTNRFLEEIVKKGEVSWLGNLNLAVLGLTSYKRDKFLANITKVGTIKILLLRPGQIIDIGKSLELSEIEPYPLKIFDNIVSGKLEIGDIVAILTKDIFEFFSEYEILKEIIKTSPFGNEKKLKEILENKRKEFAKISGICLLCVLTKNEWVKTDKPGTSFIFQKPREKFSLSQLLLYFADRLKKSVSNKLTLRPMKELKARVADFKAFWSRFRATVRRLWVRKNIILTLLLTLLLLLGFLLF